MCKVWDVRKQKKAKSDEEEAAKHRAQYYPSLPIVPSIALADFISGGVNVAVSHLAWSGRRSNREHLRLNSYTRAHDEYISQTRRCMDSIAGPSVRRVSEAVLSHQHRRGCE